MRIFFLTLASVIFFSSSIYAIAPYEEPADTSTVDRSGWASTPAGLQMGWVSKDVHYRQNVAPAAPLAIKDTTVTAWRGERLGLEALIACGGAGADVGPVKVRLSAPAQGRKKLPASDATAGFMRYVLTTAYNTCGYPADTLPTFTVADMIDLPDAAVTLQPRTVRPLWASVEIPRSAAPGIYSCRLELVSAAGGKVLASLCLNIDVSPRQLPAPSDYSFFLDLWQQPYAIARYYNVEPWSDEHLRLLAPYADMLARAGQKTVSVILFYEPWGEQSNDKFLPMVETVRTRDGRWRYDYSILDRYVEFMDAHGVDSVISCFTMIPWDMQFRYLNEATGKYEYLKTNTSAPEYEALWTDFLQSLAAHLREKGWYDKSMIVMDERGVADILNARRVARKAVPGIKMSLAGNYHPELADSLESYTILKGDWFPDDILRSRRHKGLTSLVYTCCANTAPNIFSNSAPADGAYIPIFSTATGFDGYLHWSFTNWTDNPATDTRFHMFAPGDTYFVYPDGRSSIRYERLLEGIQMSEKIRLLKEEMQQRRDLEGLEMLNRALLPVRTGAMTQFVPTSQVVNDLQRWIDILSAR